MDDLFDSLHSALESLINCMPVRIARYETSSTLVSTILAPDTNKYETCILDSKYNNGQAIVVQEYETEEEALIGHNNWVLKIRETSPEIIVDVSSNPFAKLYDFVDDESWRINREK